MKDGACSVVNLRIFEYFERARFLNFLRHSSQTHMTMITRVLRLGRLWLALAFALSTADPVIFAVEPGSGGILMLQ